MITMIVIFISVFLSFCLAELSYHLFRNRVLIKDLIRLKVWKPVDPENFILRDDAVLLVYNNREIVFTHYYGNITDDVSYVEDDFLKGEIKEIAIVNYIIYRANKENIEAIRQMEEI